MNQLNVVGIESPYGYKTLELYEGNLLDLDERVDLLVPSAVRSSYIKTPGTLVQGLHDRFGLDVGALHERPPLLVPTPFSFWLSEPVDTPITSRLLCLEFDGPGTDPDIAAENLFVALSVLELKGGSLETVALPLLGAGSQQVDPEGVMRGLLGRVQPFLTRSEAVRRMLLVERDPSRARLLDEGMDTVLNRQRITVSPGEIVKSLRTAIDHQLDLLRSDLGRSHKVLLDDLHSTVTRDDVHSYEIGVMGRRLAEAVVNGLSNGSNHKPLAAKIGALASQGVASWVVSYLHLLRVFGNEAVHENSQHETVPPAVQESDLTVCLVCIERILDFWHRSTAA